MSSVAIPQTKPAAARPPFGGPPTRTGFDSRPEEGGDPIYRRIVDSVNEVLKACRKADAESAEMLQLLVQQRKRLVKRELDTLRMFDFQPMPPLLSNLYSLDFLSGDLPPGDSDVEKLYVGLLQSLDEAEEGLLRILCERNG